MIVSNLVVLILRMIYSTRYIEVKVHWVTVLPSVFLLCVQAAVMALEMTHYIFWSFIIFCAIILIQMIDLIPVCKEILKRRKGHMQEATEKETK